MIIQCTGCKADLFLRHWTSEPVSGVCCVCGEPFQTAGKARELGFGEVFGLTGRGGAPVRSGRDSTANPRLALAAA